MKTKKIKIGLVDDHTLVREGIKSILGTFVNFEVILEASNGSELINKLDPNLQLPEIILIDISMPIMNGFETMEYLKENYPNIRCIALSVNADYNSIFKMIKSGAKAYLVKDCAPRQLNETINEVMLRGDYFDSFVIESLIKHSLESKNNAAGEKEILENLNVYFSRNELEFIKLNCSELNYSEIAEIMHLSPRTIEGYRDSVFKKIKVKNRQGLILFAIKNGIYILK